MLKPKKIIQLLSALLLLGVFWIAFILIQGLFKRKISHHELHIPKNAESVLEIEGEALIKTFVQEVLLEGRFTDKVDKYTSSSESSESLGMDFLSTFYVFTMNENSTVLTGILVNILDDDQFSRAMKSDQSAGTGFAVKEGVGLMLYDYSEDPMDANKLDAIAAGIVEKKSGFDIEKLPKSVDQAKLNYWKKDYSFTNESKSFSDLKLSMSLKGKELKIKGDAQFQSSSNCTYPVLEKSDLSIQSQLIPNYVNDFWTSNMSDLGLNFPKMCYVNGNYHYSEPSPIPELKVLPHFDGIYSFDENFQIRIPLIALMATGKINSLNLNSFDLGDKTIYYKQIDRRTIYMGQSKYNPVVISKNTLFEVSGDLKQLLEIQNGGMMTRLLTLSPEYNAAKRFLSGIKNSEFYIKDKDGKTVDLSGDIEFEDDKSAFNEMMRLILDVGALDY